MTTTPAPAQSGVAVSPPKSTGVFDVGVNERLPLAQLLALGIQNVFGMTGMFIFPGLMGRAFHLPIEQIAYLYGMTFIVCGVVTTFHSVVLLRLPVVQGPYAASFAALIACGLMKGSSLGAAYGSACIAGLIWCVLSIPIRNFSVVGLFGRYVRAPLISGVLLMLIMIQVANVSLPNWIGNRATPGFPAISFTAGLIAVLVLMGLTIWGKGLIRRLAILIGLAAGTIFFASFRHISFEPVLRAPLLVAPHWFPFGFAVRADFVIVFLLVLIPASMGSMSMYQIVADWGHETLSASRMSQGIFALAVGAALSGIIGGYATLVYPDNMGILRSTRVGSRYATLSAGVLLIVLGSCIKFDLLLTLVPMPVLSASATLLFGIVFMHGIAMLAKVDWDDRKLMAAGFAILFGFSSLFIPPETLADMPFMLQTILKQPIISGGIIVVVLYSFLCSDTREARN